MKEFQRQNKKSVISILLLCIVNIIISQDLDFMKILVALSIINITVYGILSVWDFKYRVEIESEKLKIFDGKKTYQFEISSIHLERRALTIIIEDSAQSMMLNADDELNEYLDDILIQYRFNQKNTS